MYKQGSYVGKSLTQVGKSANTPEWVTGDGEVYNKWAQALASCKDLIADAALAYAKNSVKAWTIILPVLVVRDGTLWAVNYDLNGNASPPKQLDEVNFYVGKDYTVQAAYPNLRPVSINYMLSHLHIFTLKGFRNFINSVGKTWDWKHIIPIDNQTSEVAGEPF